MFPIRKIHFLNHRMGKILSVGGILQNRNCFLLSLQEEVEFDLLEWFCCCRDAQAGEAVSCEPCHHCGSCDVIPVHP